MRAAVHVDHIQNLAVFQNGDGPGVHVAHKHGIVRRDRDSATRRRVPDFEKLSFLVKDGDAFVIAVTHEYAALRIHSDSMWKLKLSRRTSFDAADDPNEFPIPGELNDPGVDVSIRNENITCRTEC